VTIPTLKSLGWTKRQSSENQRMAEIPMEEFEQILQDMREAKEMPTSHRILVRAGKAKRRADVIMLGTAAQVRAQLAGLPDDTLVGVRYGGLVVRRDHG